MRICIVPTMFPKYKGDYYGPFVFNEAKTLVQKGHEVHVVTPYNQGAVYEEIMDGINVHRFKWLEPKPFKALAYFKGFKDNLRLFTYFISLFFNLIKINRKYGIEIIHAHTAVPTGFIAAIVAKIMQLPLFITVHGIDIYNFENDQIFKRVIRFSLNSSEKAIAVSDDLVEKMELLGVNREKIVFLRNAVDRDTFKPLKNKTLRENYGIKEIDILILFVGYLDVFKGIFETIEAFHDVAKKNDNIKLTMVSEGPKKGELKEMVSKFNLEDKVIFAGEIAPSEISKYYQAADIFVLPSHIKGIPVVVIEAMACGLPVVVSNTEIIDDGLNGFLVPPNDKDLLAQKLEILINDPNLREKFRNEALKTIDEEFNISKKVEKLIKLYSI
jgi:N-acetyl-alpha-D-glucosaminyl L-malate synthase BshA